MHFNYAVLLFGILILLLKNRRKIEDCNECSKHCCNSSGPKNQSISLNCQNVERNTNNIRKCPNNRQQQLQLILLIPSFHEHASEINSGGANTYNVADMHCKFHKSILLYKVLYFMPNLNVEDTPLHKLVQKYCIKYNPLLFYHTLHKKASNSLLVTMF